MGSSNTRRAIARAAIGFGLAGIVASCAGGPPAPAPVFFGGQENSGRAGELPPRLALAPLPRPMLPRPMLPRPEPASGRRILVERGQSLSFIAHRYHVSQRAIIAANHLRPPYKVETGAHLLVPGAEEGPIREAALAAPLPPPRAETPLEAEPPPAARPPDVIPLDTRTPPPAAPRALTPPAAVALPPPRGELSVAEEAREDYAAAAPAAAAPAPAPTHDGRFPWPVHGRILAGYGTSAGKRNDGINIAAPRGTPVRAIDSGEVAYAGNEVPGYGNLILVKHADGWISAYAHCEDLLVSKGEAVHTGEVIAKVGMTGGVNQPQLHFELRRGKDPVDPRDFLMPLPSAANQAANKAG